MPTSPHWHSLSTGLMLSASLIIAIGAQNSFVLRQGIRREHVAAVVAVCAVLDIALMSAGVLGLGAVVTAHPQWLTAATVGGAAVLAWYAAMAWRRALHPGALQPVTGGAAVPLGRVLAQTLSISLLNPHVYLDTVVLVGAIGARQPAGQQGAFLVGAGLASALWFAGLGFGGRVLAPLFTRPAAWRLLDLAVGLSMAWIAVGLLAALIAGPRPERRVEAQGQAIVAARCGHRLLGMHAVVDDHEQAEPRAGSVLDRCAQWSGRRRASMSSSAAMSMGLAMCWAKPCADAR